MRIISKKIKVYSVNDLLKPKNSEILERVINEYRSTQYLDYIYEEAFETVNAFIEKFPYTIKTNNSWLAPNLNSIDDNILELAGLRLRNWLINNLEFLYSPKYIGSLKTNDYVKHKRIKSHLNVNSIGNRYNPYYSGCQVSKECNLTGVYYDIELLQPIYDFIAKPNEKKDLTELLKNCFSCLKSAIEKEIEYTQSDEYIIEDLKDSNNEYFENGEQFI